MSKKVLIVGGVAGGASTAARLRRMDEKVEIILFERGKYISYANCGLPYYIGGAIEERSNLLLQTPEGMGEKFNMEVRVENEVLSVDKDNKKVKVKNLKTGEEYDESYDVLVLSPGSSPLKPPIPGIDLPNVFSLWTVPDTDKIKSYVDQKQPKRAVVVGGGFIGIEMAENLHDRGLHVSIVEMADQIMNNLDYDMAQLVHAHVASKGVNLHLGNGVKQFEQKGDVTIVHLQNGEQIETDMVILSIGVKPNGQLASDAGLDVNQRGGIIVNEYLQTSDENIYALGDAIEVVDFINHRKAMIPLAGPANKQGRIVANNICGRQEKYKGTQGSAIAKVFDLAVASTGNSEKVLGKIDKNYGKNYRVTYVHPNSHAGYYPGGVPMTIKLIFDMEGKVLGSQIVGYDGVDKRIDVIAASIRFGGTVYDLEELELAYAPPFSSAKDPVNMAGFTAENILSGVVEPMLVRELEEANRDDIVVLDVREPIERDMGFIDGSINIPLNDLRKQLNQLPKDKTIVVYCAVGIRAYIGARILMQNGYKAKNLLGGYRYYSVVTKDYNTSDITPPRQGIKEEKTEKVEVKSMNTIKLNACGLQCPGPIMQVYNKINDMNEGEVLEVTATDPGFPVDVKTWCEKTNNTFIRSEKCKDHFVVYLKKGPDCCKEIEGMTCDVNGKDGSSMVVFSGDLDKAIASFIIANGAAAMGKPVTMFFTFWGLNVLRKDEKVKVSKSIIEKMFGKMMPRGSKKLGISRMNMAGMGSIMIKKVMKDKNVDSLEDLIALAKKNGVRIVACTMSMDVMGLKKEELMDGIEYAGVASYLGAADDANVNLFI
ncbi:FAD-dependent oxidoreductase [Vallitalea okinawensis]|uniref:FAD-dependent oxidoreductase n=1 Tax=Vallitalea okinawensis TaxID=2078660 RepID=UPI000CFBCC4B|nr:FAD-dependent oxidoreductase [Vallitalea okinawensis]